MKKLISNQPTPGVLRKLAHTLVLVLVLLPLVLAPKEAQAARMALVIGNNNYKNIAPLSNAVNDANLMAATLKEAGFEVGQVHTNLDRNGMNRAIDQFKARITKDDEVVFFFAGHGVQLGKKTPLLLPVEITQESEFQLTQDGMGLDKIQEVLQSAKFALLIIDACRDNPFPPKADGTRGMGLQTGLNIPQPAEGSIIIMSAGAGQKALDYVPGGTRANGLFTHEFVQSIKTPGLILNIALLDVRDRVKSKALKVDNPQSPTYLDESGGRFVFFAAPATAAPIVPVAQATTKKTEVLLEAESETWGAANSANTAAAYQAYLRAYPNGHYVAAANIKLEVLKNTTSAGTDPDTALWSAVEKGGTEEDYEVYLKQNPKGKYIALAKQRLQKLKDEIIKATQAQEQSAWEQAQSMGSVEGYNIYLSSYAKGKYAALALARIDKIKKEQAEQEKQKAALAQLEAQRQQREQQQAAQRQEDGLWQQAQNSPDKTVVQNYLSSYPQGRYVAAAKVRVAQLEREEAQRPTPGRVYKDCADCPELVELPAGSFTMGSNDGFADEKPIHNVNIQSFAIGKTEVTQGQWRSVMGSNPSKFKDCGDNCPVEQVSWDEAQEYIRKLNSKTGKQYRLPSESEWEYAARAGISGKWSFGDEEGQLVQYAWYEVNSGEKTHPVGTKKPNAFGLYDMHGNVWEWTQDCWNESYTGAPTDNAAWATGNCGLRVVRGGSWNVNAIVSRSAVRDRYGSTSRSSNLGFRLARMLP